MGRLEALRQVIIGQEKAMEKELNELQKMGIKTYLDNHNAWLERKELDAFSVIEDPLNDANFKIQTQNRLIIGQSKYISLATNPKLGFLLSVWRRIMSRWALSVDEKLRYFGVYAKVEMEELHTLSDGKVLVKKTLHDLTPKTFQNLYFQYHDANWQKNQMEMMPKEVELIGASGQVTVMKPRALIFEPLEQVVNAAQGEDEATDEEEREISDRLERFGNVEIIPRGWYVYSWLHPEKFSFPNTPIVLQTGPQQQQPGNRVMSTSSFGDMPTPNQGNIDRTSTA